MSSTTSGSSGYSSYSPISTLERQYVKPMGQRLLLFCQANRCCVVHGGVETVLKVGSPKATSRKQVVQQEPPAVETEQAQEDPFVFLNQESSTTAKNAKKGFGKSFLKTIQKTTKQIERGVHSMAIKADKGRNPDWYVMGLYNAQNQLICMTDSVHAQEDGLAFCIPLALPPTPDESFVVKLWIRSGATLLKQTKAAKNYLVASTTIYVNRLRSCLQASGGTHAFCELDLQSHFLLDQPQIKCCLASDLKLPVLCGLGWSLSDPHFPSYQVPFHRWVLDQSYGYTSSHDSSWLIGTERATESTLVLPLATAFARLVKDACDVSLQHATAVSKKLLANRHDSHEGARVQVGIGYLVLTDATKQASSATFSLSWQRPDCIFEVELIPPGTKVPVYTAPMTHFVESTTVPLYAKVCPMSHENILPLVRVKAQQLNPSVQYLLGSLRVSIQVQHAGRYQATTMDGTASLHKEEETWEAVLPLESLIGNSNPISVPVTNVETKACMGNLILKVTVDLDQQAIATSPPVVSSRGGLVSLVGLDTLLEDSGALPVLDYDPIPSPSSPTTQDPTQQLRQSQMQTMGNFLTHAHLQNHVTNVRTKDVSILQARHDEYTKAIAMAHAPQKDVPSYQDKSPKPFRPSSSRTTELLAGIGFNVHVQSLSLTVLQDVVGSPAPHVVKGALFHNVTCGAPADHARGFGNYLGSSGKENSTSASGGAATTSATAVGTIRGGLRRLEAKRLELSKALEQAQASLIGAVGQHLSTMRHAGGTGSSHISARHAEISAKRWSCFEMTQHLTSLTWTCAVRRANVFSQALGIAVSSYLTSLADAAKASSGWPSLWVRNGYLVTFEGLLSAAGKELGMIEDASVGISMLRMVNVVLVCDDANANTASPGAARVAVPHSPYLKWVQLSYSGKGSFTQYLLEIGVDPLYYEQRIPEPLKHGASVQLYPVLYQVGVDIRQWGAHAHMNAKQNLSSTGSGREEDGPFASLNGELDPVSSPSSSNGGTNSLLDEDNDDDVGDQDNDVLIQLNIEASRKMNSYAHMISPVDQQDQVHPLMVSLHGQVMSSAGKMVHGIVDEAASVAQRLGGGGVVFCKSGKDRTAMQVTYKQSQFVNRFLSQKEQQVQDNDGVFENATLMRVYGTRLPICEKNVGQAKFAFNSLQVKFMPDMLKPPPNTLAGFLKGGKIFTGGGIES